MGQPSLLIDAPLHVRVLTGLYRLGDEQTPLAVCQGELSLLETIVAIRILPPYRHRFLVNSGEIVLSHRTDA